MKFRQTLQQPMWLLAAFFLMGSAVGAAENPQDFKGQKMNIPKIEFEKHILPNGIQLLLHVDRKLPIVHVNQWFHVGSKNEKPGRTGFAHLFEHLMFQGSKNAVGEYFSQAEKAGANLREGGVNGTTGNDRTNYFATVPSANLEFLLWLESDRMATLADAVDQGKLDNQRDVVKNERRQSYENRPYGKVDAMLPEALFPAGHPYSWPVIGSHEDLTKASLDDVKDFFKTFYTPNNLTICIAGDFDPAEAKKLVEKYFGGIPTGPALARPAKLTPKLDGEKVYEVNDRVPQGRLYLAWHTPAFFDNGDAELDLSAGILSDGLSSRLNKKLVYDQQLCTSVEAGQESNEITGTFVIVATLRPDVAFDTVETIINEELARLAKEGPTPEELGRVKTKREYGFISGLERIGGFGGKADLLNQYNTYLGDPEKFQQDFARYSKIEAKDIAGTIESWLNTKNRVKIRVHPEQSGRAIDSGVNRAKAPEMGADKTFAPPTVKSAKLENGMEILVVERPELPKVSVGLVSRNGLIADPAGKEGAQALLYSTIALGTKARKALEIEDALSDLGTRIVGASGIESGLLFFEVLSKNLEATLTIFSEVVLNPSFPEEEVAREKKRQLDGIKQEENEPNALAARIRAQLFYGTGHPMAHPASGYSGSVASLSHSDLQDIHQKTWKPDGSVLIFVGDITLDRALELSKKYLGSWAAGKAPAIQNPPPKPVGLGKIYVVDRQDAPQTVVAQVISVPDRKNPIYYSLMLADAVYAGGGFGTRLNMNLRQDKGYTYGVRSRLGCGSTNGIWVTGGGVQSNKTKESMVEFLKELEALGGKKPISAEELSGAKTIRIRGYAQRFESLNAIMSRISELWALGLPMTEFQNELDETVKSTLEEVNKAAAAYAKKDQSFYLLVGDLAKIQAGLKELNYGEVVVLDAQGNPVKK